MDIFCLCPFTVGLQGWDPAPGRRSLSICIKATFVLVPGAPSTISPLQEPVRADEGSGGAPDLVPFKPRVDILFTGHAHAPGGAPTDSLIARARIGAFRKSLSINGDRTWVPSFDGLRPSVAVPFRSMPLVYERAVRTGENLIGVDISQGAELNKPLANIAAIADQGGETPGLAPIPLGWRAMRLGQGDAGILWASRAGVVQGPPPAGFDFRLFNAAPSEQQVDELPPGADVLLENLHPEVPHLETRLPFVRVKVFRRAPHTEASTEVATRCDTLWIDTDRGLAMALWRAAVLLEGSDESTVGRLVITAEGEGERISPAEVDRMLVGLAPAVTYVDAGQIAGESRESYPPPPPVPPQPLPLPASAPPPRASAPVGEAYAPMGAPPALGSGASRTHPPVAPAAPAAKPSAPPAPVAAAPEEIFDEPTPQPSEGRRPITLVPPPAEPSALHALPFRAPSPTSEAPAPPSAAPPPVWGGDEDTEVTPARGYPAPPSMRAAAVSSPEIESGGGAPGFGRFGTIRPEAAPVASAVLPPPLSAPPVPMLPRGGDVYCSVKMDQWHTGKSLAEVLALYGMGEAEFRAEEAARREALAREAAEGRSELAIALLEGLAAADRG